MIHDFDYSNLSPRPPGRVIQMLGTVLPGVRRVQEQTQPYAERWAQANVAALQRSGPLWVALGDSMTQGIGASDYDRAWVGQLSDRLRADGWEHRVVNLSVSGARVAEVLEHQIRALDALTQAEGAPALVTCIAGSNDIVSPRLSRGLVDRFEALLDRLPRHAVVSNLPNPHQEARQIDALLQQRQREGGLVLADMLRDGPRSWRGKLAPDKFHPNDRGYAEMSVAFERALDRSGLTSRDR